VASFATYGMFESGTSRTSSDVRVPVAIGGKADIANLWVHGLVKPASRCRDTAVVPIRYSRSSLASAPLMTLRVGVMGISAIGTSRSGHLSLATP
jgi:hypothetical protein